MRRCVDACAASMIFYKLRPKKKKQHQNINHTHTETHIQKKQQCALNKHTEWEKIKRNHAINWSKQCFFRFTINMLFLIYIYIFACTRNAYRLVEAHKKTPHSQMIIGFHFLWPSVCFFSSFRVLHIICCCGSFQAIKWKKKKSFLICACIANAWTHFTIGEVFTSNIVQYAG